MWGAPNEQVDGWAAQLGEALEELDRVAEEEVRGRGGDGD